MFNHLKRVVLIVFVVFLLVSLCSGCKPEEASSKESDSSQEYIKDLKGREILWYVYDYDVEKDDKSQAELKREQRFEEIEKKFNCKIKFITGTQMVHPDLFQSILSGTPSAEIIDGGGPHVVSSPLKSKCYIPLDSLGVFDLKNNKWDELVTEALTFNGKTYGVMPVQQGIENITLNQVLYFNKRLVKDAGYDPDSLYQLQNEGKWTWEKFEEIVKAITALKKNDSSIWGTVGNEGNLFNNLVFSNNTDWIKKTDTGLIFDADNANSLEAIEFYKKLYDQGNFPEIEANTDSQLFLSGKIGFIADYLKGKQKNYPKMKDDYGILLMPKGPKSSDYRSQKNWFSFWSIATGVKQPEDLALVLDHFCDPYWTSQQEVDDMTISQMEAYVRDEGSIQTLKSVFEKSFFSPISYEMAVSSAWYYEGLPPIKSGQMSILSAIESKKGEYNAIFSQWADFPD